jgi:hypothetical protein
LVCLAIKRREITLLKITFISNIYSSFLPFQFIPSEDLIGVEKGYPYNIAVTFNPTTGTFKAGLTKV